MQKNTLSKFFALVCLFSTPLFSGNAVAEPTEGYLDEDIVCSALLPCSPPTFAVFPEFANGPCGKLYESSCARWREVKAKADALDIAAEKLLQCQQEKKGLDKNKKKSKGK